MQGYNELLRRIKPEAIICYCKPFEEMKGNIITVEYDETNNLKQNKTFYGSNSYYIKKQVGYIIKGFGGGVGNNDSDNSGNSINNQPPKKPLKELPENIKDSYDKYQTSGWKNHKDQTPGTKAGKIYENDPPKLPTKDKNGNNLTYREYDVNNKLPGQSRDGERFVRDNNGKTYYTDDHYDTFTEITED